MNPLKLLLAVMTLSSATADLIGYNRLGNNVNGHILAKNIKNNSYKSYMNQLKNFFSENPTKSSKNVRKFAKKFQQKSFARRTFYSAMMNSLY